MLKHALSSYEDRAKSGTVQGDGREGLDSTVAPRAGGAQQHPAQSH